MEELCRVDADFGDAMRGSLQSLSLGAVMILLLTAVAHIPAMRGWFIWDDDAYVTENRLLTAPDGLKRIWFSAHHESQYFPLVFTTLRFERMLWGLNPIGYHAVNVLLHGMNALLVWAVLRRLALPGAWLATAIWAVHPVSVESAAWITELKNTQSTLFYLLALLAWMKFTNSKTVHPWRFYALAGQGKLAEATAEYQAALRIRPDLAGANQNLGNVLASQGRMAEAMAEYRETLRLRPDWPPALGGLAWILATSSNESVRNGGEAVQLAERLCAVNSCQEAEALDVLAAAYAEAGRFDDAVRVAQRAVEAATAAGPGDLAGQIQERLKLYRASRPYRAGPAQSP